MSNRPAYGVAAQDDLQGPFHLYADYSLVSDDTGHKGHKLSQQLTLNPEFQTKSFGRFGFLSWMEFVDAPMQTGEVDCGALIEADYGPYWAYDSEKLGVTVQLGWLFENFPRRTGDQRVTQEAFISFIFDDSKWFGTKEPVLSPFIAYYHDVDDSPGGRTDVALSHCFTLSKMGMETTSILKNIEVIPSFLIEFDNGELGRYWAIDYARYGAAITYDLSSGWQIDPKLGRWTLTTFLFFRDSRIEDLMEDRWFGGISISVAR